MNTFSISYDLRKPGRNYQKLIDAITSYSSWAHPLESHWIIQTQRTAEQVRDHLREHMDSGDGLLVLTCSAPAAWYGLGQKISDWLQQNLTF